MSLMVFYFEIVQLKTTLKWLFPTKNQTSQLCRHEEPGTSPLQKLLIAVPAIWYVPKDLYPV